MSRLKKHMELMYLKRLNRVLSVLLALSLCVSLFSIAALAGEDYDRPAAEAGLEELVTPTPNGGEEEGALRPEIVQNGLPAPTASEEEKEDVSSALFAATLVEKLKSHVLTEANHNGTADRPGTPGIYSREYDAFVQRLEAVVYGCAAAYADQAGPEVVREQYDALVGYNKINSTHDKAIVALLSEVLAAGVAYTHTVTGDGFGTGGRSITGNGETFYTYCSEPHFAYPGMGVGYLGGEPVAEVSANAARLVRALEAGYPLDSYGLSRYYDDMLSHSMGLGMNTQQVIWDILAGKSVPTYQDAYSRALFTYATTDQVLERVDAVTVAAQPEGPAVLTYDEAGDKYTGYFTLSADKYAEITAVKIPENAEATYSLPGPWSGTQFPLTDSSSLVPGSVVTVTVSGAEQSVSDLGFSYVSYRRVGGELSSFLNYGVVYDGAHEVGKPYQTMIGFGMEAVMGALDVTFTLAGKPGEEPEKPETAAGTLTLEKVFAGAATTVPEGLTFTLESGNGSFETWTLTLADFAQADGVYACTLEKLPLGTYTFTEQNAGLADYNLAVTFAVGGQGADRAAAVLTEEHSSAVLRITNTYTKASGAEEEPPYVPPYRPPVTPVEPEEPTPGPGDNPAEIPETPGSEVEIPEENIPLADRPEQPPEPVLPDEPTGETIIVDENVPLGGLPQTGTVDVHAAAFRDGLMMFFVILSALSLAGLTVCIATRKR